MKLSENDPFAIFMSAPPNETSAERQAREKREAEQKRISDRIDEELKAERTAMKKQKAAVKVLILGQSESDFRMKYARAAWKAERQSWRAVIQLNLIRSVLTIIDTIQAEINGEPLQQFISARPLTIRVDNGPHASPPRPSVDSEFMDSETFDDDDVLESPRLTDKHELLMRRLGPLRRVEADLKRRLGAGTEEVGCEGADSGVLGEDMSPSPNPLSVGRRTMEFGVRGWKYVFEGPLAALSGNTGNTQTSEKVDNATEVIAECKQDIWDLWADATVRAILKKRRINFLNDLERIATKHYEPADDDIVRARLRTLAIQEYKIEFEQSHSLIGSKLFFASMTPFKDAHPTLLKGVGIQNTFGREWKIYDVGGARTARNAWLPYFEGVNAIIFPISCFDERLLEDPNVNRLEDSFLLWRAVCRSKILSKTTMILFLNKCDILKRKLRDGAQVKLHLPSYGDRPNDAVSVLKYLRDKFKDILRQHSPEPRVSYFYATSVTDTKATATTLKTVRDSILREHLKNADLV
ncbi:hypothetical protein H0H93_013570 [Arthromyces matolae]|nr:hypothetical protein H0H93_013570 [Arthromyces matolae]